MAVPPLPCVEAELDRLRAAIGSRPLWLAASTHPGEEALIARVHGLLRDRFPGLLTLIVPRHPQRGPEIAAELGANLRSAGGTLDCELYVADTMGELGLFYRLAPIVFVGKSIAAGSGGRGSAATGGQNPFEPARLGAAVLFGPSMDNFPEMAPSMVDAGAAEQVADEAGLAEAVGRLLADPALLAARRRAALAWADSEAGVLDALMDVLAPFLEAARARP